LTSRRSRSRLSGKNRQRSMVVVRRPKKSNGLSEAKLTALTGVSHRNLTRWRQQGLIQPLEPRRGLGPGRGTTRLRYSNIEVSKIRRLNELRREFKKVVEWRWRLWLEGYPVRITTDLARTLDQFRTIAPKIKTLDDVETMISDSIWRSRDVPRGNPLRTIFRDLRRNELHSVTTMLICVLLGIRLPLFDEPNAYPFQIFKRAFGLPKEWEMPPGLFDVFPYMHTQIINALSQATSEELEGPRAVCQLLSHLLDNLENSKGGAISVLGAPLSWEPIKLASLLWPSPVVRAATVGLVILGLRGFKSALGAEAIAAFTSFAKEIRILSPESAR
jgi:hypothetical protein